MRIGLILSSLVLASSAVMADGCDEGYDLFIQASITTCDKEWVIQREYNMNADVGLCESKCDGHETCKYFSLSEQGTCTTYTDCSTTREAGQTWDTYEKVSCETATVDELAAPASTSGAEAAKEEVKVALDILKDLEVVLQEIENTLDVEQDE